MKEMNNTQVNPVPEQVIHEVGEEKKSNKIFIIILIIFFILLIAGVIAYFLLGEDSEKITIADMTLDLRDEEMADIDSDEVEVIGGTELGLNDELEDAFKLSEDFPQDLPLSGGRLIASASDSLTHSAQMSVNASILEAQEWYESALTSNGWEITEISNYSPQDVLEDSEIEEAQEIFEGITMVEIKFEKAEEGRSGDLLITANQYSGTLNIAIREVLVTN